MSFRDEVIDAINEIGLVEFESYQIAKMIDSDRNAVNFVLRELENSHLVKKRVEGYYTYWSIDKSGIMRRCILRRMWDRSLWH
jgi:predicted transcriptional regulator